MRATLDRLNAPNQDRKRSVGQAGRQSIRWLVEHGPLPENVLLHIEAESRQRIMSSPNGQQRLNELFRLVQDKIIPRETVLLVAQQLDPVRRARHARATLAAERIIVLGGTYDYQMEEARLLGYPGLAKDEWISTAAPEGWTWQPGEPNRWLPSGCS
jgi:hypothetical protein